MVTRMQNKLDDVNDGDIRAIKYLKDSIVQGKHWYIALLEAIKLWRSREETYNRRHYSYLIDDEAFDWLLLAERLIFEIDDFVPEKEKINLLFYDRPPKNLGKDEFRKYIGTAKYRAYLNYLYGVLVEEALVSSVIEDIRKERRVSGWDKYDDVTDKAYKRIYGQTQQFLVDSFKKEKKYTRRKIISLSMLKEFRYWLFKYRLKHCDRSRVASDTKKALLYMQRNVRQKKVSA
jgi:hypothetical protein